MMPRPANASDFLFSEEFDGLPVTVWVDVNFRKRRRLALKFLPVFVKWWRENGEQRHETIYGTGVPMAVRVERSLTSASAIP